MERLTKDKTRSIASWPVRAIVRGICKVYPHNRVLGEVVVGTLIAFFGGWLASKHPEFVPDFIWDTIAYAIHGIGLAPLAELAVNAIRTLE